MRKIPDWLYFICLIFLASFLWIAIHVVLAYGFFFFKIAILIATVVLVVMLYRSTK